MLRLFAVFFLLLSTSTCLRAQAPMIPGTTPQTELAGMVYGTVTSVDKLLGNIKVYLISNKFKSDSTVTDDWGQFWMPIEKVGNYSLRFLDIDPKQPEFLEHSENFQLTQARKTAFVYQIQLNQYFPCEPDPTYLQFREKDTQIHLTDTISWGPTNETVLHRLMEALLDNPDLTLVATTWFTEDQGKPAAKQRLQAFSDWMKFFNICPDRITLTTEPASIKPDPFKQGLPNQLRFKISSQSFDYSASDCSEPSSPPSLDSKHLAPILPLIFYAHSQRKIDTLDCLFASKSLRTEVPKIDLEIDSIARLLLAHPHFQLRITGHTDATEAPDLSWVRAGDLAQLFLAQGVPINQLDIQGAEDRDPIVPEQRIAHLPDALAKDWARARNRRVTLLLYGPPEVN